MKYIVKIEERLVRHVAIEADNEKEATAKAERLYNSSRIVLDTEDFEGVPHINCLGASYQRPEFDGRLKEYE